MCLNLHVFFGDVGQIPSRIKDSDPEAGNCYASLQMLNFFFMFITKCVCGGAGTRKNNMSV